MKTVLLRTLGQCAIETKRARLEPDSRMTFALALYLVLERGKLIPRQTLLDFLWPDAVNQSQARHRFRQTFMRVKQHGIPVTSRQEHVWLDRDAVEVDFESLLTVNGDAEQVMEARESLEFLPGYSPRISERFGNWLELHRARVHTAVERCFLHALHAARERGDWPAIERLAIGCLRVDPYNEEATMARAEATVLRGSKAQALAILDGYMEALGEKSLAIGLPAKALRSRIAERLRLPKYAALSEKHFVGREAEIAQLTHLLDAARQGSGGGFVIWGEPGIGKSRLVQEISTIAEMTGLRVVTARCQPTDAERPLSVFVDLVPVLRALPGSLGVSPQSVSLLQRFTGHGGNEPDDPGDAGDGGVRSAAMRRALFDLIDAVADEATLLLVVEDVHWADPQSLNVIVTLAEWSVRHRVAIVLTSRSEDFLGEVQTPLSAPSPFRVAHLGPLTLGHAESLLTRLASDQGDPPSAEMVRWCTSMAEGNPYHLRELLTHWLETNEPFGVTKSLAELIERRVASLSPDGLRLLQVCVTFGSLCTLERLEATNVASTALLLAGLEELGAAGVVIADGNTIRVKHELLAQAARARFAEPAKRFMHRRVATVLESESGKAPSPTVLWECAHHWACAGEPERGVGLLDMCGKHLLRVGLPREAAELYRKALGLRVARFDDRAALYEGLISALRRKGLHEQVLGTTEELRNEARLASFTLEEHSWLELTEVEAAFRTGRATERTLEQLQRCLESGHASATHKLNAAFWLMAHAQNLGRSDYIQRVWALVVPLVASNSSDPTAGAHVAMVYHTDYGDLDQAVHYAHSLVEHTRRSDDPVALIRALRNAGLALRRAGCWVECKGYLMEGFDTAKRYNASLGASDTANLLAAVFLQENELALAARWIEISQGWFSGCESAFQQADLHWTQILIAIAQRDLDKAHAIIQTLGDWRMEPNLRYRQVHASFHLALAALQTPTEVSSTLLTACQSMYASLGDRGNQDSPVESLAIGLDAVGNRRAAKQLIRDYLLKKRRDRGPIPSPLKTLAQSWGVDLEPN